MYSLAFHKLENLETANISYENHEILTFVAGHIFINMLFDNLVFAVYIFIFFICMPSGFPRTEYPGWNSPGQNPPRQNPLDRSLPYRILTGGQQNSASIFKPSVYSCICLSVELVGWRVDKISGEQAGEREINGRNDGDRRSGIRTDVWLIELMCEHTDEMDGGRAD